ncbi:hypothetical protein VB774_13360 [Pseudanabaena galeata UHCC 0370]|jgi:hypothetical protein|uniref:Uncharacterized protein n=1 Tax=Pseudanabaena galeata UHCC 0370 TaxID=3110310 RepID=A0ABU5TK26_9CYAN|nr:MULTISPECIES: hypothetical protein [Pseudanabaena]MEA5478610.1 hypothetical protein [Pseudanabaena galeata UHCC 0370]MEA5485202.1 hypothetical protein [Pseudanabaena sp. CCNP1317]WGS72666.1 hypothetical protein OA858_01175 [Pseudanabaena galeata CCNP1313]
MAAILIIKIGFNNENCHRDGSSSDYKNYFFESPPTADFQKNNFSVSSTLGARHTKIVFIMRIAG